MKPQVAVRVTLICPDEVEIQAWSLGLEPYYKGALSQGEWARMSCQDIYTAKDWYGLHPELDQSKSYELYIEGTMTGSIDHNSEADEELNVDTVQFRELDEEELLPEENYMEWRD